MERCGLEWSGVLCSVLCSVSSNVGRYICFTLFWFYLCMQVGHGLVLTAFLSFELCYRDGVVGIGIVMVSDSDDKRW